MSKERLHVCFVVIPRFNMLTVTGLIEPLRVANYLLPSALYSWDYRSPHGNRVVGSNGMALDCFELDQQGNQTPDLTFVCGSWGAEHFKDTRLTNWLRKEARRGAELVGVEMGVYLLARAGLLENKTITTHWSLKAGLEEEFPDIDIREQLYTHDGKIHSVAGGSASIDFALRLVARDHGETLASEISNQLLHHSSRPATASQRLAATEITRELHPLVKQALELVETSIEEPLTVPTICTALGASQRNLERLFKREVGCSIVQYSRLVRLQYARVLLSSTRLSIREVSVACGFNSLPYFSHSFLKCFGRKPSQYRQAWPEDDPAPSWPGTLYSFVQKSKKANLDVEY